MTQVIENEKSNVKGNEVNDRKARLEKLRANLAKLKEAKREQSTGFIKINANDTKLLEFTGDMDTVMRSFKRMNKETGKEEEGPAKQMYAYKVIDVENREAGVQTWEISRKWSDVVDNQLTEGFVILKIKRTGSAMDTNYLITVVLDANANAGGAPAS